MVLSLFSRSPFVSFHIPDIAMELRTKKRYNFKDVLRGKHPTKKQSQVREYIPRSTCVTFIIHLDKLTITSLISLISNHCLSSNRHNLCMAKTVNCMTAATPGKTKYG